MKFTSLATVLLLGLTGPTFAEIVSEGANLTPVMDCGPAPESTLISASTAEDAGQICRAAGLLDGVRTEDIRNFSKAVIALKQNGYGGSVADVANQLVAIVKLRGLDGKPDRWLANLNIVVRAYQFYSGTVTPHDALKLLSAFGPEAQEFSDEDFRTVLVMIKERKRGED